MKEDAIVFELRDGGYLMAGFKNIVLPRTHFLIQKSYLVRLDHYGNILWEKIIGDSTSSSSSVTLIEDPFGNIYLPYYSNYAHLAKLNSKGEVLWIKDYTGFNIEIFFGISFINNYRNLALLSQNLVQQFRTASVTKLDSSGNLIWNKAYYDTLSPLGSYYLSSNNSHMFLEDKYFICGFVTPSPGVENRIGFIIKLDTSGNIIWNKRYPNSKGISSIAQNSENTFIASGQPEGANFLYCQKFDSSGNLIWNRTYGNDALEGIVGFDKIIKNFDNNFILGTPRGYNYGSLLTIDSLGNIITSKYYYYPQNFYIEQNNINNTTDSGYIVAGSLDSNNAFSKFQYSGKKQIDVLLFKIDRYGNTVSITNNNSTLMEELYSLSQNYPNPFNPNTVINYSININSIISLKVFDLLGKEVVTIVNQKQIPGNYSVTFDGSKLPSGVYFYKLDVRGNGRDFIKTKRMVLLK